jgi:Spy/CpxP family protein refolding chaperone
VTERLRELRDERLLTPLGLTEPERRDIIALMDRYEGQIAEVRRTTRRTFTELERALERQPVDAAEVDRLVDALTADQHRIQALKEERTAAIRRRLTPAQFGRLAVRWPRVQLEMQKVVLGAIRGE